jgi:hypothetical protein
VVDERILGSSEFVERVRKELEEEQARQAKVRRQEIVLEALVEKVCEVEGVRPEEGAGGGQRAALCRLRKGVAYLWIEWLGHSGPQVAQALGIRPEAVYRVAHRGRQEGERWRQVLEV